MSGNRKLGRTSAQRKAMLRGMVTLLLETGKIETTYTRAKEVSAVADSMITLAKQENKLASYRKALGYITREDVAKKLFDEIAPSYEKLAGGYTQIYKLGPRRGDAAEMAIVRLVAVDAPVVEEKKPAKKKAPAKKAAPAAEEAPVAAAEEAPATEAAE